MPLDDIVTWLASAWSISEAVAGVISSMILIMGVLFPVMLATMKAKNPTTIWLVTFFSLQIVCVGIGWLPYWVTIVSILIAALGFADQISKLGS